MNEQFLENDWKLISSENIIQNGVEISSENFEPKDWYNANIPSTVLATLVENSVYENPYFGTNLKNIANDQFKSPWWYRKEFDINDKKIEKTVLLIFEGINYSANIWLNGNLIANSDEVFGAYRQFEYNISNIVRTGNNVLAVEVIPPKPGDFTVGFVDWNPSPPDNNLGIFRNVKLQFNSGVSILNPFVNAKFEENIFNRTNLTVTAELNNHLDREFNGVVSGLIGDISFSQNVSLNKNERRTITFSPSDYSQLNIDNPKLWWPNNLGEPNLYNLELELNDDQILIDKVDTTFGIRKVEDYINDGGHRGYIINGHKLLIRGAGWSDDLFLQDTDESLETQIKYVKHMNLNCIRLEGFWGKNHKLYNLCDENGILMMVGWSCQWEHEQYLGKPVDPKYGGVIEPDEIELISESWEHQLLWLRNHPSIFVWTVGSDMLPHPDLERKYIETFDKYDNTRPYLNSTGGIGSEQGIITSEEIISEISGSSRVKMLGPYAYTPPVYWFTNKNLGGAYGFNTETCPGANVPPIESLKQMIPEGNLWPVDSVWNYHCGKNNFSHIDRIQVAIEKRYGKPEGVDDFAYKAQVLNYELMRPMFEAFQINQNNATGIIQWMLNSAWPEMYWQLYDTFLMPNGAYYGAKKANQPIQLIYNYGDNNVYVINNTLSKISKYKASINILNIASQEIYKNSLEFDLESESSKLVFKLPSDVELSQVYFLDMHVDNEHGKEVSNNFYWLSSKEDVLDYETEVEDWAYYTPTKEYADFTSLISLPKINLDVNEEIEVVGDKITRTISIENNNDTIAFFIELLLFDKTTSDLIIPVLWSDNYISILPNKKYVVRAGYSGEEDNNELRLKGWNLA